MTTEEIRKKFFDYIPTVIEVLKDSLRDYVEKNPKHYAKIHYECGRAYPVDESDIDLTKETVGEFLHERTGWGEEIYEGKLAELHDETIFDCLNDIEDDAERDEASDIALDSDIYFDAEGKIEEYFTEHWHMNILEFLKKEDAE